MNNPHPPVITTPLFWDCECDDNYIHPVNEVDCLFCGIKNEDAPDARLNEVIKMLAKDWSILSHDYPLDLSPANVSP
jgi:hypothetical protein